MSELNNVIDVEYKGWQRTMTSEWILLVTNIESRTTVKYNPEKHRVVKGVDVGSEGEENLLNRIREKEYLITLLKQTIAEQQTVVKELIEDGLSENRVIIQLKRELKEKEIKETDITGLRCL